MGSFFFTLWGFQEPSAFVRPLSRLLNTWLFFWVPYSHSPTCTCLRIFFTFPWWQKELINTGNTYFIFFQGSQPNGSPPKGDGKVRFLMQFACAGSRFCGSSTPASSCQLRRCRGGWCRISWRPMTGTGWSTGSWWGLGKRGEAISVGKPLGKLQMGLCLKPGTRPPPQLLVSSWFSEATHSLSCWALCAFWSIIGKQNRLGLFGHSEIEATP